MNTLMCGLGSIGRRHLENLLTILNKKHIRGIEPHRDIARLCIEKYGIDVQPEYNEQKEWKPDIIFICTPTHMHATHLLNFAKCNAAIFIEKPLAQNNAEVKKLLNVKELSHKFIWVGCNMRYHPAVRIIKSFLDKRKVGRIFYVRSHFSHYLPNWRPGIDFRSTYSANSAMGGGILLDDVHQLDLIYILFGPVKRIVALSKNTGYLKIDPEEIVSIICEHENNTVSEMHMDYLRRDKSRGIEIIGEKGSLVWHSSGKNPEHIQVTFYDNETGVREFLYNDDWSDVNDMYLLQQEDLFQSIAENKPSKNDVEQAAKIVEMVEGCRRSSKTGQFEPLGA